MRIWFRFEPRDLWIGVYWTRAIGVDGRSELHLYVCLLPTLLVHVMLPRERYS